MPKYYCDYCDIFLTHDSPSVRKSHNDGWKHKAAVRAYYQQFESEIFAPGKFPGAPVGMPGVPSVAPGGMFTGLPGLQPPSGLPSMPPPGYPMMPPSMPPQGYPMPPMPYMPAK